VTATPDGICLIRELVPVGRHLEFPLVLGN
jgi:hypothetical protein